MVGMLLCKKKVKIKKQYTSNAHRNKTPITPNFRLFLSVIFSNFFYFYFHEIDQDFYSINPIQLNFNNIT